MDSTKLASEVSHFQKKDLSDIGHFEDKNVRSPTRTSDTRQSEARKMDSSRMPSDVSHFEVSSSILTSRASMLWKIERFSTCSLKVGGDLQSPEFSSGNASWVLQLYPNGESDKSSEGNVGIYLMKVRSEMKKNHVTLKICLRDKKGDDRLVFKSSKMFGGNGFKWGFEKVINRKSLFGEKREELLMDDTLIVFCNLSIANSISHGPLIEMSTTRKSQRETYNSPLHTSSVKKLVQDLKILYENQTGHDVILKAEDKDFPAHRVILKARSSVFSAMFEQDIPENQTVIIEDISARILDILLRYLYTGHVEQLSPDNVVQLYKAGDKYALEDLKAKSLNYMSQNVSVSNICDVTALAEVYNESGLKSKLVEFYDKNLADILSSSGWKDFETERPDVAGNILKTFVWDRKK